MTHSIAYFSHLYKTLRHEMKGKSELPILLNEQPSVAILVAARHEPKEILRDTFRSISNLTYSTKTFYLLDDSSDPQYMKEASEVAEEFGAILFRRDDRHGAKAGILNDCLKTLDSKYIAIFDADQCPMPSFLRPLVALLEQKTELAFVQTPQFYTNLNDSPVARGAAFQQSVFYEYICESKSLSHSIFCCGTNVVFRKEALDKVGHFVETSVTEDIATSFKLHQAGYSSMYYGHVGTFGLGPETLSSYFQQQSRWSKGNFGLLRTLIVNFISKPSSLTPSQWFEYFLSGTYYFVGLTFFLLMLGPILYLFFNLPSFFIQLDLYLVIFLPYILFSLTAFYFSLRTRGYSLNKIAQGQLLSFISFPQYLSSMVFGLLGIQGTFGITMKGEQENMSYFKLSPQVILFYLNISAFVWGLNRFYYELEYSILVSCFWALYHALILSSIFYFNSYQKQKSSIL